MPVIVDGGRYGYKPDVPVHKPDTGSRLAQRALANRDFAQLDNAADLVRQRDEQQRRLELLDKQRQQIRDRLNSVMENEARFKEAGQPGAQHLQAIAEQRTELNAQLRNTSVAYRDQRATLNAYKSRNRNALHHADQLLKRTRTSDDAYQRQLFHIASATPEQRVQMAAKRGLSTDPNVTGTLKDVIDTERLKSGDLTMREVVALMDPKARGLNESQTADIYSARREVGHIITDDQGHESVNAAMFNNPAAAVAQFGQMGAQQRRSMVQSLLGDATELSHNTGGDAGARDDMDWILQNDKDLRFVDENGHTGDASGHTYTYADFLNRKDHSLALSTESTKLYTHHYDHEIDLQKQGRVDGYGGTRTIQGRMNPIQFQFYVRQMAENDPFRFAKLQRGLWDSGYFAKVNSMYGPGRDASPVTGRWDTDTRDALRAFMGDATADNLTRNVALEDQLSSMSWVRGYSDTQAKANRDGGGGSSHAFSVTDPLALNSVVDQTAQKLVGRNLTDIERQTIVAAIQTKERTEGAKTSGAVVAVDPGATAEELIRRQFPNDTKAHNVAGAFDMFANLLQSGMGIGNGGGGFGSSQLPTGTL